MIKQRLYLGYETAFWIWRKAGALAFNSMTQSRMRALDGGAPTVGKVREQSAIQRTLLWASNKCHV